ncbi:craniofacial development protein 2-like [Triplophysa rosa]|uniref:craniofacial development protein 2-like n=1 Tax=Triplophysa rosa TaxID=992332 RepID=UPI00254618F0|nr:craniofacial development protein 2-like [Triplophysa rosa]
MNQGKLDTVKMEMARMKISILGISELKWTGMGHFQSGDYKVFYAGHDANRKNGVALIVEKETANAVMGYNPKNDRMISIQIQGHPINLTIIQVYAPTTDADEDAREAFYSELQQLIDSTPKKDAILIIGDWNAKVGEKEEPGKAGKEGLGYRNEAGDRLMEFCHENCLCIMNTWSSSPKEDLTPGPHQMGSVETKLITYFAVDDGKAQYCQQRHVQEQTVAQTMNCYYQS